LLLCLSVSFGIFDRANIVYDGLAKLKNANFFNYYGSLQTYFLPDQTNISFSGTDNFSK
jgi:hypothetical protein